MPAPKPNPKPKPTMVHEMPRQPSADRHVSARVKKLAPSATLATSAAAAKLQKRIDSGEVQGFGNYNT